MIASYDKICIYSRIYNVNFTSYNITYVHVNFFLLGNYDKFLLLCMHKPVFNLNVFIESKDLKIHGILLEINLVDLSLTEYFWKLSSDFFMEC